MPRRAGAKTGMHKPDPRRSPEQSRARPRPKDEKPRTRMTRTAMQNRAEAFMEEQRRLKANLPDEAEAAGSLVGLDDESEDGPWPTEEDGDQGQEVVATEVDEPEAAGQLDAQEPEELPQGGLPVVAIVGRPNVGKSSLFNRLAGSRIAIEDPRPGTTRDRVSALVGIREMGQQRVVELYDTAGIGIVDEALVEDHVHEQIQYGIARADLILFVVDAKDGPTTLDLQTAQMLRRTGRAVLVVANKADVPHQDDLAQTFHELGLGEPHPVSAKQGRNIRALKRAIIGQLPPKTAAEKLEPPEMLLAIVGRRNAGKSSLVNALAGDNRVIVSELPGTTRDSVDVRLEFEGKSVVVIDTAGLRKKQSFESSVDFFSQSRSLRAVRRASVVLLLLDAREPVTRLDRELVEVALRETKPIIIGVNKWDLAKGYTTDEFRDYLAKKLGDIDFAPMVFLSAKTGQNVFATLEIARELHAQAGIRIGTGELNRIVNAAYERHHPQPRKNKLGRLFYATQTDIYPPTIVLFVNDPDLFPENWRRYLVRQLQEKTPYGEVPIRLKLKARERVELAKIQA